MVVTVSNWSLEMHWPIICSQDEEDENSTTLMLNCLLLIGERLSGKSGCLWKKSGDITASNTQESLAEELVLTLRDPIVSYYSEP